MVTSLTTRRWDDLHAHFRLSNLLYEVLPVTAEYCGRAIVMPNTRPRAILTGEDVVWYRDEILRTLDSFLTRYLFEPLMTIEIRDNTTPQMIATAFKAGAVAGKVYPQGVTYNAEDGLKDFYSPAILETFRAMEDLGMLLLLHGEFDRERILYSKREKIFLPTLVDLADRFPSLKIVLEHVSSRLGVKTVKRLGENVGATITAHHLCLTTNDVIGDGIRPHNGCMPMPKDFPDRDALIEAAISGDPKFFLGSDTAPHARENKECAKGSCGVYSAPVLPAVLAEVFENAQSLDRLEDFTSRFGAEFYGLPLNKGTITLNKTEWEVPAQYGSVVPFKAGEKLQWQLV